MNSRHVYTSASSVNIAKLIMTLKPTYNNFINVLLNEMFEGENSEVGVYHI